MSQAHKLAAAALCAGAAFALSAAMGGVGAASATSAPPTRVTAPAIGAPAAKPHDKASPQRSSAPAPAPRWRRDDDDDD